MAINLLGANDARLDGGDIAAIGGQTALSIAFTVKLTANAVALRRLVTKTGDAANDRSFNICVAGDGNNIAYTVSNGAGQRRGLDSTGIDLTNGTTYRVVCRWNYNGGSPVQTIVVNGTDVSGSLFLDEGTTAIGDSVAPFQIGRQTTATAVDGQDGDYAEIAIWGRYLTDQEASDYGNGYSPQWIRGANSLLYVRATSTTALTDEWGGATITNVAGTNATHPAVVYWPQPAVAAILATGSAPTFAEIRCEVPVGTISGAGLAPALDLLVPVVLTIPVGALATGGLVPISFIPEASPTLSPTTGAVTALGRSPVWSVMDQALTCAPGAAVLRMAGRTPAPHAFAATGASPSGKVPDVWLEFVLEPYPNTGSTTYKWATRPLADSAATSGWKEARVITGGWSTVERALSDARGNYEVGSFSVVLNDTDGTLRSLLTGATTRYWTNREAAVKLLSEAGRKAGLTPRTLFRGIVAGEQLAADRRVRVELRDLVGSSFSAFNLDKTIPSVVIDRTEHPNAPDSVLGRAYPILYGEHSDVGALDVNGDPADKGLIPVIYTGEYVPEAESTEPVLLDPPVITVTVEGSVSSPKTYTYGCTYITPFGETRLSNVVQVTGPAVRTASNRIKIAWAERPANTSVRVYGRTSNPPSKYLDTMLMGGTALSYYDDDDNDVEKSPGPPTTNTAQIEGTGGTFAWGRFVVALGVVRVTDVYASDLAEGATPKRVVLPAESYGSEVLIAGEAGWPHAQPYLEINGIRMTVIYLRGPRLKHHTEGTVTVAVNVCGYDDVGDGSGTMIDQAFFALQHCLNEHVLLDGGTGYRGGDWSALETFSDGGAMLWTRKFEEAQATTARRLGNGSGYLAAWALTEPLTVRQFLQQFCVTFDAFVSVNHHGQVFPVVIDDAANPDAGPIFRDRVEILSLPASRTAHDEVENRITYQYDWDADAKTYRVQQVLTEDATSIAAHKGARARDVRSLPYTRDPDTAEDAMERRLARLARAPRYQPLVTSLAGLEVELGDQIRVQHYDDVGGGAAPRPYVVMRHETDLSDGTVTLTGLDVSDLLT